MEPLTVGRVSPKGVTRRASHPTDGAKSRRPRDVVGLRCANPTYWAVAFTLIKPNSGVTATLSQQQDVAFLVDRHPVQKAPAQDRDP